MSSEFQAPRLKCVCCESPQSRRFVANEMQYGSREPFDYRECLDCGALQIESVPQDLARHYHHDKYASWRALPEHVDKPIGGLGRWIRARRAQHVIDGSSAIGAVVQRLLGPPEMPQPGTWKWLRAAGAGPDSRIFDFGCGTGELLRYLRLSGFGHLTGYDKFSGCASDLPGLRLGGEMPAAGQQFDLVMAHHSLEHLPDPVTALRELRAMLAPGGTLLIRVPVSQTHAWHSYGANWIQLDAPRHLFIPSRRSMDIMAQRSGLKLRQLYFDSGNFQFLGSEQYLQGIPMFGDERSYFDGSQDRFTSAQARDWEQHAERLNVAEQGDQACFFFGASSG